MPATPSAPCRRWHRSTADWSTTSIGIARLFTPPFEQDGQQNPGYIKGYPPGVRENGGQYTHGAIWSVFAWAELGDGERASALFDLLNPIRHSDSAEAVERYKVEPYVVSADVYSVEPACRPRRLDLVHRIGGVALSRRAGSHPRFPALR